MMRPVIRAAKLSALQPTGGVERGAWFWAVLASGIFRFCWGLHFLPIASVFAMRSMPTISRRSIM